MNGQDQEISFQEPAPQPRNSTAAVVSLVLGIVGLLCIPFLGPIIAIVCAIVAFSQIRSGAGSVTGQGFAVTGLVLGIAGLALHTMGTIGVVHVVMQVKHAIEAGQKKFEPVAAALRDGDVDKATELLSGPESPPKEELKARLVKAHADLGNVRRSELAKVDGKQSAGFSDLNFKFTWNLYGEKGDGHLELDVRYDGKEWHVRDLRIGQGTIPVEIGDH
ncbi:MAG TPA: DUF4190 domain-containing protein [Planctomycetota bacterium]|nr:DUF4190 domain-containing protein [Planctomycetota bacterium]